MNQEKMTELLEDIDIDIDIDEVTTMDELDEQVNDYISEQEMIYYANAIDYLAKNDASLNESLGLASEMGYETKDLNSEVLATILLQQNMGEDYAKVRDEIEELFS